MVLLIAGASHTGKTLLAQKMLQQHGWPYLSIDHLKMGLIRSGHCLLTAESDDAALTAYLWPVLREMIKTAIENKQNLIVEGCYIPFDYEKDFEKDYLQHIRYRCLIMSENYIQSHFADIAAHACDIEQRLDDGSLSPAALLKDNRYNLEQCQRHGLDYILIEDRYHVEWPL